MENENDSLWDHILRNDSDFRDDTDTVAHPNEQASKLKYEKVSLQKHVSKLRKKMSL